MTEHDVKQIVTTAIDTAFAAAIPQIEQTVKQTVEQAVKQTVEQTVKQTVEQTVKQTVEQVVPVMQAMWRDLLAALRASEERLSAAISEVSLRVDVFEEEARLTVKRLHALLLRVRRIERVLDLKPTL